MVNHREGAFVPSEGPSITFGVSYPLQRHLNTYWLNRMIDIDYLIVFVGKEFGRELGG